MPAQFNVDKLTVFEVVVTDANNEALEKKSDELRTNLDTIIGSISVDCKLLLANIIEGNYSSSELLEIVNSARTPHKLCSLFYKAYSQTIN